MEQRPPAVPSTSADAPPAPSVQQGSLPSGRTVVVRSEAGREEIEIRSPAGQMELRIALTDEGPVLTLRGVRLEIDSTDTVAVSCRQFSLRTTNGMQLEAAGDIALRTEGEIRCQSAGDTRIDGKMLMLNCGEREGYPDGAS